MFRFVLFEKEPKSTFQLAAQSNALSNSSITYRGIMRSSLLGLPFVFQLARTKMTHELEPGGNIRTKISRGFRRGSIEVRYEILNWLWVLVAQLCVNNLSSLQRDTVVECPVFEIANFKWYLLCSTNRSLEWVCNQEALTLSWISKFQSTRDAQDLSVLLQSRMGLCRCGHLHCQSWRVQGFHC